jgi:hypothetical protein
MVTVPAGLAEFERSLARPGEGRSRAIAGEIKFRRKSKLTAHQIIEAKLSHYGPRVAAAALQKSCRRKHDNHCLVVVLY